MMSKHFSLRPQLRKTLKTCRRRFAVRIYNHRRSDQINVAYSEMRIKLLKNGNHSQKNSTVICHQARNQLGQTKPYVSRLGSYQCCTLKIEISDCNEFGFFGQLLDVYRKIFLTSLITSQNKAIRFCFFPYPAATMFSLHELKRFIWIKWTKGNHMFI